MNKKGLAGQVWVAIIFLFILLLWIIVFWSWSLVAPYIDSLGTSAFQDILSSTQNTGFDDTGNMTQAGQIAFTPAISTLNVLETLTFIFLFFIVIGFVVMCVFARTYPFLIGIWIIGMVLLILVSLILTTTYQDVSDSDLATYTAWTQNHFIMSNLPVILLFIGIVGGIIMFVVITRDNEIETGGQTGI